MADTIPEQEVIPDDSNAIFDEMQNDLEHAEFDRSRYAKFDDLALGVMQANAKLLAQQNEVDADRVRGAKPVTARFDVTTARKREHNQSTNEVDLKKLLSDSLRQAGGDGTLPSQCCYIESLHVEDAMNTLPVDVHLTCRQNDKVIGSFVKGKIKGEEAYNRTDPSLYVVHSGSELHSDAGREVFRNSDFIDGDDFKMYLQALKKDVEDHATPVKGSHTIEYTSPWAVLTQDDVVAGDWLVNVMYKNPESFQHQVTAVPTPAGEEGNFVCNLRLHAEDWKNLNKAVQQNVIAPLRNNIIDLDSANSLHFNIEPDCLQDTTASNESVKRSGVAVWRAPEVKGHEGRAALNIRATIKFV